MTLCSMWLETGINWTLVSSRTEHVTNDKGEVTMTCVFDSICCFLHEIRWDVIETPTTLSRPKPCS
jgi:hypothetical protein